jgi:hypothetical protein
VTESVVNLDTICCHFLATPVEDVAHLKLAALQKLGTLDLQEVILNMDLPPPLVYSKIEPNLVDRIAILLNKYHLLSKLVFASSFTPLLNHMIGRTPPGRLRGHFPQDAHLAGY